MNKIFKNCDEYEAFEALVTTPWQQLQKGRPKMPIGTVSHGRKKIKEGRWQDEKQSDMFQSIPDKEPSKTVVINNNSHTEHLKRKWNKIEQVTKLKARLSKILDYIEHPHTNYEQKEKLYEELADIRKQIKKLYSRIHKEW
jgi:hypothetical protein